MSALYQYSISNKEVNPGGRAHRCYDLSQPRPRSDGLRPTTRQQEWRRKKGRSNQKDTWENLTLRFRQASHEKALFRGRLAFPGISAMPEPELLDSTTTNAQMKKEERDPK